MTERAAHLVDAVLPRVPVRQWVLTVPYRLRYRMALDHGLSRAVLGVFTRVLLDTYAREGPRAASPVGGHGHGAPACGPGAEHQSPFLYPGDPRHRRGSRATRPPPTGCEPCYGDDGEHIREYMHDAASDEGLRAYLARHVLGTRDHTEYLGRARRAPAGAER